MSHPADEFSQHLSDDDVSNHEDASDNGDATNKPKQQQLISTATTISNIKLPILKKEEYDIWAMEMEHYLEYIDNDVWKVIQNGNSKKRISTGKDGVIRVLPPVSAAEIHAVEKERKARTILLMAIPKEHLRRFHGMDDAKEIWEAIRTRFGGNANSKKMQKAVLKQQFEAFSISSSEGLEKGYDRFQQLLSQLEAHGAEVSTEDANHKFLRSLPPAWSNLAMTMRTKPDVDTLSIDDLYNNLRVFEQELTSTSKSSASAQNVAFVSHSKSSTNKVKSGHTGAYSTYTPTSSNNIQEREVPAGFADEVIYSLFAKQSEDLDLLHEDLEQIDDVDIEEMDINWQIAMIAIRMKKFYKKTGRRVRIDGNKPVGFDKKKLECFKCHNTGHFARECPSKGTNDGKKRDSFYQDQGAGKKEQNQNCLLTMDDGVVNWGEHTVEEEETNHALMAISSNTEVSLCSKTCIDSYNKLKTLCDEQMNQLGEQEAKILAYTLAVKKLEAQIVTFQKQQLSLNEQLTFQANEIYAKDEKLKRYRRIGMKAVKEKEQLKKTVDSWKDSSKNLWKLIDSGMSSTSKVGLGYEIKSNNEVLSYEEEMNRSVFKCTEEDYINKPLYSRFTKTNSFKGVPHLLTGDYTFLFEASEICLLLAKHVAENRPSMLEKSMYDSWASRILLFIKGKKHEWSKFVTDVKLAKSLYTTNYDQLYAYLSQHERHANEVHITRKRYPDPLALVANSPTLYNPSQSPQHSGEDPIECINKVMEFLSALASRKRVILDEEQLAFLADPRISKTTIAQQTIPQNSTFQTEDLDAYDSDCDDLSLAKAVLMVNLSSYDPEVLSEVPYSDSYPNDMINQDVQEM
ncbi:ribonuclease H-like domain-containing protein [Tanacetum coccineum]